MSPRIVRLFFIRTDLSFEDIIVSSVVSGFVKNHLENSTHTESFFRCAGGNIQHLVDSFTNHLNINSFAH